MTPRKSTPPDGLPLGDAEPAQGTPAPTAESFELVYGRLEQTVKALEEGNLSLDEALRLYEEGAKLAQRCAGMLDAAELRITRLRNRYTGAGGETTDAPEPEL